jgi:hypothetical protein
MGDHVDMTDEQLAEWRAQHPGRDRPRVVTGTAHSKIAVASDDPEPDDG